MAAYTSDDVSEAPGETGSRRVELASALLLGLAAIATAYAAYYSAIFGGNAIEGYTTSTTLTAQAADIYGDANGQFNYDRGLFVQYASYLVAGDVPSADTFAQQFMDENLFETVLWYNETGDEVTDPFDTEAGSPYALEEYEIGNDLTEQADAAYQQAKIDDDKGDRFDLAAVLLALSLFFGGIASVFKRRTPQLATLAVGTLGFVGGMVVIVTASMS